ncbi:HAMP domain-containing protein, partial [Vibrio cholerae]|uniref:HAMP domain-containing protein n=1 Tax=Vibrio cholerae TaxID=666 RepID=UPI0030808CF2
RSITQPCEETLATLKNIAQGEGDLTRQLTVTGKDELAQIAQALHLSRGECDHFAPLAGRLIGTVRRLFSLMGRLRDFLIG